MYDINYVTDGIKHVCETYKRRLAGSASERACQEYFACELSQYADKVDKEQVTLHPKAFMGSIIVQALFGILTAALFWGARLSRSPLLSVLCCISGVIAFASWFLEFVLYRQVFDRLYPKAESDNVIATRKSSGKATKQIIFVGHADAAYEMAMLSREPLWLVALLVVIADIGVIVSMAGGILQLFMDTSSGFWSAFAIAQSVFMLAYIPFLWLVDWRTVTDGANDNLTGCYISMEILRNMERENIRFEHTDVRCLITCGEEAGLRGAFAYAKRHGAELMGIDTVVIAVDTINEPGELMVYPRGICGTQRNSEEVCELLRQAGRNCGVDLQDAGIYPGANDADAFSRRGIKATAICGVCHSPAPYYHTRLDTWDNINPYCISKTMEICGEAARLFDAR